VGGGGAQNLSRGKQSFYCKPILDQIQNSQCHGSSSFSL
jgi:hypothetical protein